MAPGPGVWLVSVFFFCYLSNMVFRKLIWVHTNWQGGGESLNDLLKRSTIALETIAEKHYGLFQASVVSFLPFVKSWMVLF